MVITKDSFSTVPDELLEHAVSVAAFLRSRGYTVHAEKTELGLPVTPTLWCVRRPTTLYVEVDSEIRVDRLDTWLRYGKSLTADTRVAFCLPADVTIGNDLQSTLAQKGVGLYRSGPTVFEACVARDLALNVELPDLAGLQPRLQRLLGPVYEQFERSNWREGFLAACNLVVDVARRHLKSGIRSERITILDDLDQKELLTEVEIDRMPLQALAAKLSRIRNQNSEDVSIARVLNALRADYAALTLKRSGKATETKLRANVGRHMWVVVEGLRLALSDAPPAAAPKRRPAAASQTPVEPRTNSRGARGAARRPALRRVLQSVFKSVTDFEAFCSDNFPDVYATFAPGMNRTARETALLESVAVGRVEAALRLDPRYKAQQHEGLT